MLQTINKSLIILALVIVSAACGTKKKSVYEGMEKLPKVKESVLIEKLDSLSKRRPDFFYTRINSKYEDKNTNLSFRTTVRAHADSAVQATITFANIPIYNSIATPDSLVLLDRRNKCYIQEDMSFLKRSFNVDFTHRNIEELFIGLPVAWDSTLNYRQLKNPYHYIVSAYSEKEIQNLEEMKDEIITRYFLSKNTEHLEKIIIDSPKDTTSIEISYSNFEFIENFNVPSHVEIKIKTARNDIFIDFKYTKTTINERRTLFLAIPDNYERCE
mgnify:CR=1 FL=1